MVAPEPEMVLNSPAKVNLTLRVGPARPDGFHPLVSWFCVVGLTDVLRLSKSDSDAVQLTCDHPGVPCDGRNLILRAAELLRPYALTPEGLNIHLTKRIPMGGGLGGGSSNAAAALKGISSIWKCRVDAALLQTLAAQLGSDVPFFLNGPSAICRGRGEEVGAFPLPRSKAVLLLLPGIEMPTPKVYRTFDEMGLGTNLDAVELPSQDHSADELLQLLVNDLEAPAFAISPPLAELRARAERLLARPVRMSGSGSTLFTLYDQLNEAQLAAARVKQEIGLEAVACALGILD